MKRKILTLIAAVFSRPIAINATLTPLESTGSETLHGTAAIAFKNALVTKTGAADDRHFVATANQADIPYGVLLNDELAADEVDVIKKGVAILGLFQESLPMVSDGSATIAAGDRIVASVAAAGKVKKMPATSGQTYIVIGRARFDVAATANDPVSVIHCVPYAVTNP